MVNRLDGSSRVDLRESLLAEERPAKRCCTCTPCEKVGAIAKDYFNRALALSGAAMTTAGIVLAAKYGFDETTAKVILYTGCRILGLAYARVVESLPPKEPRRSIELTDVGEEQNPSQFSHPNEWVAWKNRLPGEFRAWRALPTAEKLALPISWIKGRGRLGWHYILLFLNLDIGKTYYIGAPLAMVTSGYWLATLTNLMNKSAESHDSKSEIHLSSAPSTCGKNFTHVIKTHRKYLVGALISSITLPLFTLDGRTKLAAQNALTSLPLAIQMLSVSYLVRPFGMSTGAIAHLGYTHPLARRVSKFFVNFVKNPGIIASAAIFVATYLPSYVASTECCLIIASAMLGFALGENDFVHSLHSPINYTSHTSPAVINMNKLPWKTLIANNIYHIMRNNSGTLSVLFWASIPVIADLVAKTNYNSVLCGLGASTIFVYRLRSHFRERALQIYLDRWRFDCFIISQMLFFAGSTVNNSDEVTVIAVIYSVALVVFLGAYQGGINDEQKRKFVQGMTFEVAPTR